MSKVILTYKPPARGNCRKRSRLLADIAPVCSEEEAMAFIEQKRKEHFEATHNCYAYVLKDAMTRRYR